MTRINLTGGFGTARSNIASTQRRLNLYAEATDPHLTEPGSITHYPTPGLVKVGETPNGAPIRGMYRASNGDLYVVAADTIYYVDGSFAFHPCGTILNSLNKVNMIDNGTSLLLCDGINGTANGWSLNLASRSNLLPLYNPSASDSLTDSSIGWTGSTYLDYVDGFVIANHIGTPGFYISNPQNVIFDPVQTANKNAFPDTLVAAVVQHRVIWLIGQLTTEVWYDTGGATSASQGESFPFAIMPGVAIDKGCIAPLSIAKAESCVFWLSQDSIGNAIVMKGQGYNATRVSTHPIEHRFKTYPTIDDCIAFTYQQEGHVFYVMNFPTANETWVYDLSMNMWHQRCYTNPDGGEQRIRASMHAYAYGVNLVNDWTNDSLYRLDLNAYTDNGTLIKRVLGFPRLTDTNNNHRLEFKSFSVEIDANEELDASQMMTLRWSDNKGKTWVGNLQKPMADTGDYQTFLKFQKLGMARNRNFELEWNADKKIAVQGAYVDYEVTGA